jgi:phosphoribosylglycinamide formyltransferase-1
MEERMKSDVNTRIRRIARASQAGVTLVEVLIVVAIMAMLAGGVAVFALPNAQRQALEHGVKLAGCTVHFVDASLDGGPIILQAAVAVEDDDDLEALRRRILAEEHRIVARAVELFARGSLRIDDRRVLGTGN